MADQCIVCLEDLDTSSADSPPENRLVPEDVTLAPSKSDPGQVGNQQPIAIINPCGHILHDECLREWSQKANSCPICRQAFNLVDVLDKIGGSTISSYAVEDKKQVAEFDPAAWIDDQIEEEEPTLCPICNRSDDEEVLLLCDACDASYHTYCVGLDGVPHGHWFCMECVDQGAHSRSADPLRVVRQNRVPRTFAQRTQAQRRRAQNRARTDAWQGAWNQISSRVWAALDLDLDYDDDDQSLAAYRNHQRRIERERREFQQWQQRLSIAGRQGARDVFRDAARPLLTAAQPEQLRESREEAKAWDTFEKARAGETSTNSRKRKSRSSTQSPREAPSEPERKLKRPRTRRVVDKPGSSSDGQGEPHRRNVNIPAPSSRRRPSPPAAAAPAATAPSFLSSLLKEVEMSSSTDDESVQFHFSTNAASPAEQSSPVHSPATSNYSTPRAMSITPPPYATKRSGSPTPLSSRVEPVYPPADYSPNRPSSEFSANTGDRSRPITPPITELRQPRPRRNQPVVSASTETSPTRGNMSIEAKEGINKIVRTALEPHYKKADGISKEQYANINRLVSRMLYEKIADPDALDEDAKSAWEKIASAEVARAVEGLMA